MFAHHYNDLRRGLPTILRLLNKPNGAELRNSSENKRRKKNLPNLYEKNFH